MCRLRWRFPGDERWTVPVESGLPLRVAVKSLTYLVLYSNNINSSSVHSSKLFSLEYWDRVSGGDIVAWMLSASSEHGK